MIDTSRITGRNGGLVICNSVTHNNAIYDAVKVPCGANNEARSI